MSAAQFRSQESVALYLGAKPKIRATVAGEEKMGIVACMLAAQAIEKLQAPKITIERILRNVEEASLGD